MKFNKMNKAEEAAGGREGAQHHKKQQLSLKNRGRRCKRPEGGKKHKLRWWQTALRLNMFSLDKKGA